MVDFNDTHTQLVIVAVVLFAIVGSSGLYDFVDSLFSPLGIEIVDDDGKVTLIGLAIHTLVFLGLLWLACWFICKDKPR